MVQNSFRQTDYASSMLNFKVYFNLLNSALIVQRFGELMRKLWNPRNFKTHVSPHEMLQAVVKCSKKQFQITQQGDPILFLSWFLNALHKALNGTKCGKN